MQTYDILMLLVLVAATLFGFWKGMAWQVASLASLVVSYFAALRFADQLAPKISHHAPWNKFVAMLAIYIVTSFVIWTVFRVVSGMIDRVKLDGFDRQMGALIGLAKGVLLCIAITFFAVTILPKNQKETILASRAGRYIVVFLDKTRSVVPPEIHQVIHPYVERIERRLDPNQPAQSVSEFQAVWPSDQLPSWPSQGDSAPSWPPQTPAQPASTGWPQQREEQLPSWLDQPQTAERPQSAPL